MKPVIYQLIPRLFSNQTPDPVRWGSIEQNGSGKLLDITPSILKSIRELGCTHVWLTGVIEHAHATDYTAQGIAPADNPQVVKGLAGSPYAISDYYDIDPDIAVDVERRMEEFMTTVDRIHASGMSVVLDFVPNHVARSYHSDARPADAPADLGADDDTTVAFAPDNNFYYLPGHTFNPPVAPLPGREPYREMPARASGNDCFTASPGVNDWYETVKLNYGIDFTRHGHPAHFNPVPSTWQKMTHILLYWAAKGVDAFRCDMAHMVPIEFWSWAISRVKAAYPAVKFIAEIYDVGLYRDYIFKGGFDYLYDKVNLYDTLRDIQTHGLSASSLTGCWMTVDGIEDRMLNFLENHDEQRYASRFYAGDPARVIPALTVAACFGRGAMMVYAGQELGERADDEEGFSGRDGRTTIFDYWSITTLRRWLKGGEPTGKYLTPRERWLRRRYAAVLGLCNGVEAVSDGAFFDVMYANLYNPTIDPHFQYVFIRSTGADTAVVAVNFGDRSADMKVVIPAHAFDTLKMKPGKKKVVDLLSNDHYTVDFRPDGEVNIFVPAQGATVLHLAARSAKAPTR